MPRQSSWRKEEQFFSARLGAPQRVNEPTHLGADGRYDEDESPSPVHEKKQARTRGRSSTRLFTRGRHAHGEERHTHTFQEGGGRGGWMNGVGKRMGRQCPSGARNAWSLRERWLTSRHGCWKSAMQVLLTRGTRDASARPRAPGTRLRTSNHASRKIGAKTAFARICSDAGAQRLRRASRESPS